MDNNIRIGKPLFFILAAVKATDEAKKNEQRAVEVEKSSLTVKNNLEEELEAKVSNSVSMIASQPESEAAKLEPLARLSSFEE